MRVSTVLVVLLAGCATLGNDIYVAKKSWYGARYEDVVSRWGTPVRHTTFSDGRFVYTWESESSASGGTLFPSISVFGGSGGVGVGVGTGAIFGSGGYERVRCERTLIFKDGRVVEQTWQGQAAFCSTFRRE